LYLYNIELIKENNADSPLRKEKNPFRLSEFARLTV